MGSSILIALLQNKKLWLLLFVIVLCALLLFASYCGIDLYKKFAVKSEINGIAEGSYVISENTNTNKYIKDGDKTLLLSTNTINFEMSDSESGKAEYVFDPISYDTSKTYYLMVEDTYSPCNIVTTRYLASDLLFLYKDNGADLEFKLSVHLSFNNTNFKLSMNFYKQSTLSYFNEMLVNDGLNLYLVAVNTVDLKDSLEIEIADNSAYSEYVVDGSGDSYTDSVTEIIPVEEDTTFSYLFDLTHSEVSFALCEIPEDYEFLYSQYGYTCDYDDIQTAYEDYMDGNFLTTVIPCGVKTTLTLDKTKKYILCSDYAKKCSTTMTRNIYLQSNLKEEFTHDNTFSMAVECSCSICIVNYDYVADNVLSDIYCNCNDHKPIENLTSSCTGGIGTTGEIVFVFFDGMSLGANYSAIYIDCELAE